MSEMGANGPSGAADPGPFNSQQPTSEDYRRMYENLHRSSHRLGFRARSSAAGREANTSSDSARGPISVSAASGVAV